MVSSSQDIPKRGLPHILLLVTDQLRHDVFGPTTTPNLYELATNSTSSTTTVFFSNAYSSTPSCTPARAALLTGKSPWNHGMLGYAPSVNCEQYATTLPAVLADLLGYETVVVGKNHFGTKKTTASHNIINKNNSRNYTHIDHGYKHMELYDGLNATIMDDYDEYFDRKLPGVDPLSTCHLGWNDWKACPYWFDEALHPTAWTTRQALRAIDRFFPNEKASGITNGPQSSNSNSNSNNHQRPVFLKVSYHRPHSPYDPPKRLWDKHVSKSATDQRYARNIGTDPSSWDRMFYANYTTATANGSTNTTSIPEMPSNAWHGDPGEEAARRSRAAYTASAEFVDEGVGFVLNRLRDRGQLGNTFVVWVSDHGDSNGDHNLWRKGYPWEASAHVNMVMKLPAGVSPPKGGSRVSDAIVELRDVAPTIYDLLGIWNNVTTLDPLVNGRSLLPILNRGSASVRTHLDLEHSKVYDEIIHWNAIVGRYSRSSPNNTKTNENANATRAHQQHDSCELYKYIFFASTGMEQLFCLSEDPLEADDLAQNPNHEPVLSHWRETMLKSFVEEGRGGHWVTKEGNLVLRKNGTNYGPNYPCHSGPFFFQISE